MHGPRVRRLPPLPARRLLQEGRTRLPISRSRNVASRIRRRPRTDGLRRSGSRPLPLCGVGFENLGAHVYAHDTWPDEYRAYFGLKRGQTLFSRERHEKWSQRSAGPVFMEALKRARAARRDWRTPTRGQ
jgi:hypothetical protein